jgi:NodT family efflux transporter outer membrane factor (OMF) lipoprotein
VFDAGPTAPKQSLVLGESVAAHWWELFQSRELDGLVREAMQNSLTIEAAKARVAQAQEAIVATSSALYPQAGFNAGAARQRLSATTFGLSPNQFPLPPNFDLFQVGASASYSVDSFGGVRRGVERDTALAQFQQEQLDAAYLTLTGDIVAEAIQIAALRAQIKALDEIVAIDQQNLELVGKERRAGTVPDSDVIVAEAQLATDKTLRPPLEQQLNQAEHSVAVLIGRAPSAWSPPALDLSQLELPRKLPVSLPSQLVHRRPDILAAEAQLHAASAEVGVATAQLYPSLTLSAWGSTTALNGNDLFSPASLVWSIAAGLTQPIFDGGLRRAQRRAALAAFKGSSADYQETVLLAFAQVADALTALQHDGALLAAEQHAMDMTSQSVRLQRISYEAGGSGLLNLLDAQRQYQQALLGYVRAQAQRYEDTAQLLVATGGGWRAGDGARTSARDIGEAARLAALPLRTPAGPHKDSAASRLSP